MYVIRKAGTDHLYWREDGCWVPLLSATLYTVVQRESAMLPARGAWTSYWEIDEVQFPRLLAEAEAVGLFAQTELLQQLAESMDLTIEQIGEIVDRAQSAFERTSKALRDKFSSDEEFDSDDDN